MPTLLLVSANSACAQTSGSKPAPGTFRGAIVPVEGFPRRPVDAPLIPLTGSARWRYELDSLDWRYKLTVRLRIHAPNPTEVVVRQAGLDLTSGLVLDGSDDRQLNFRPAYARLLGAAKRGASSSHSFFTVGDTAQIDSVRSLTKGSVLTGQVYVDAYRREGEAPRAGQRMAILRGRFAATFDPRPSQRPRTMTDSLQASILDRAIDDAGMHWLDRQMYMRANAHDSSHDNSLLRAFLTRRYGEALVVEAVNTDFKSVYVRVRGRYRPIECSTDDGRRNCGVSSSWWSQLWR